MNKLVIINVLAAIILTACNTAPKAYIVEGVLPDESFNDKMVYMVDLGSRDVVDSVIVIDGKFVFAGSVETPVARQLRIANHSAFIILENGNIQVDMANNKEVSGTPLNNLLSVYLTEMAVIQEETSAKIVELAGLEPTERRRLETEIVAVRKEKASQVVTKTFNANINNVFGAFVLFNGSWALEPDAFDELFLKGGDVVQNFSRLQTIFETHKGLKLTAEGMPFTDFTIENGNIDGSAASLSDYVGKGKWVLVPFWASWCGPCIAEKPTLLSVYHEYNGDNFEIVGVSVWDTREESLKSMEAHGIPWQVILDGDAVPAITYGIKTIPHIILFAPDGTIAARGLRGTALKDKLAEAMCECN